MVKNRIHNCLFDLGSKGVTFFLGKIQEAELIAAERQRTAVNSDDDIRSFVLKKYRGLAGGRLMGSGREKVSEGYTEDLMVSFKCIVGALVVSMGTKAMWEVISSLFEELLALSPETLRRHYGNESTLVKSYPQRRKKR